MTSDSTETGSQSVMRLVVGPATITLAVTLLRLAGELNQWSQTFFTRSMGASVVGITWLAPVVGVYLAIKLARSGVGPKSFLGSIGYSLLGTVAMVASAYAPSILKIEHGFYDRLVYGWAFFVVSALITRRGWPLLFKALAVYGLAARIPVAIIMFFAMLGNWGTHYDAVPPGMPEMGFAAKYLWLAFFPQLTLWLGYTVLAGMLFGTIISGIIRLVQIERGVPS